MTINSQPQPGKVLQILDWYEQPELLLLEGPAFQYTLAVRSGDLTDPPNCYVGGAMSIKRLRDYANGKCDLRFAIDHASLRRYWKFAYEPGVEQVEMKQVKRSDRCVRLSIPAPGLFAADHEDIDIAKSFVPDTIERFNVDGGWELGEFSNFYSQIEDIYYLSSDIDRFDDVNLSSEERKVITGAFNRNWDGGGSYVSFYKKIANDNDFHAPLKVSGIEYHSPGYVSIHARSGPFKNLMSILQHFADNEAEARKAASALGRYMSAAGMKQSGYTIYMMSEEQKGKLIELANNLASHFPGMSFNTLFQMASGNALIAAKVTESIFRRVKRLYEFFDRGRVSHPSLNVR